MKNQKLEKFITELNRIWGPATSGLTKEAKRLLEELIVNGKDDDWVKDLLKEGLPNKEVYRSSEHGYILMAHVEQKGDASLPHDHGDGWVIYATVSGQVDMGIFGKVVRPDGSLDIVQQDEYALKDGQCSVYLPGDIHDTTTQIDDTLMLRLTSCDFFNELEEGRLNRYENVETW